MAGGLAQTFTFYDAKQQLARMKVYIADQAFATAATDGENIANTLAPLSNSSQAAGGVVRSNGPFTSNAVPVSPGTAATYEDVADKAVFVFQDAFGGLHRYQVPCPKTAIFLADQETIDFTNALVKQFVANVTNTTFAGTAPVGMTNALVSREDVPLTAAVGGYRRRGKTPRKFNIFTRNPALSGQGE